MEAYIQMITVFFNTFFETLKNQPILIVALVIIFLFGIFKNKLLGMAGEFWVKQELEKLNSDYYKVINDVTIRTADSKTHQIDHLVISQFGIFVIETKHYSGYIRGNESEKKWFQNKRIQINNPFNQNYGHIKSLEEVLGLDSSKFISIVCISGGAKVNVKTFKNHLARLDNLNEIIKSYTQVILPNYDDYNLKLLSVNNTDSETKKEHVNSVKQIQKEKSIDNVNKCPKCGGVLVEKNGKNGKFLGCSNFPRCRYTRNIF